MRSRARHRRRCVPTLAVAAASPPHPAAATARSYLLTARPPGYLTGGREKRPRSGRRNELRSVALVSRPGARAPPVLAGGAPIGIREAPDGGRVPRRLPPVGIGGHPLDEPH